MGSDFADIVPGAVWHQLRRIRVTDIQLGSKRLMQCTVLMDTLRRLLQASGHDSRRTGNPQCAGTTSGSAATNPPAWAPLGSRAV